MPANKSQRTTDLEKQIAALKAQLRRAKGIGAVKTASLEIQQAIESRISSATKHLAKSRENDRKFGDQEWYR